MIRINLLGEPTGRPKRRKAPTITVGGGENLVFMGAIVATLLVLAAAWWFQASRRSSLEASYRAVQAERDQLADVVEQVNQVEERTAIVNQKLEVIVDLKRNQTGPLLLLDQISRLLPDNVWLTQMDWRGGDVSISGSALSNAAFSDFITNLRLSPLFTDEAPQFTEDTGDAYRFQINVQFVPTTPRQEESATEEVAGGAGGGGSR